MSPDLSFCCNFFIYVYIVNYNSFCFTFTFIYLADALIQSDLQCIQAIYFLSVCFFISFSVSTSSQTKKFEKLLSYFILANAFYFK